MLKMNEVSPDSNMVLQHPYLQLLDQEKQLSLTKSRLERSRLLPELNFGYNNTTIIGYGGDDKYYSSGTRFQSAQVGLGIPIFARSQYARAGALKFEMQSTRLNYSYGRMQLTARYQTLWTQLKNQQEIIRYYEEHGIPNAELLLQASLKQYQAGNINYLEWVMLLNQAIATQSHYADAVNNLNQTFIQLQSFNNR